MAGISVVRARPEPEYHGSGGGGSDRTAGQTSSSAGDAHSAFGLPFAGWLALSDMIASDSNPELGDTMRAQAAVFRAAIERSVADRFADIGEHLQQAGIPRWSVDEAERALLSGSLPLRAEDLAEDARQAYAELAASGTVHATLPESDGLLTSIMHYGGLAILGTGAGEVPLPPRWPIPQEHIPEEFADHLLPDTELRVAASLDLLALTSQQGEYSVWCRSPLRQRRGDNLVATEHTYLDRKVDGLTNPQFRDTDSPVTTQYRDDIAQWQPADFTEALRPGTDCFYYAYRLTEPKRSRAARRLRAVLGSDTIRKVLLEAVDAGVTAGMAAAGPPGALLGKVASTATRSVSDALVSRLEAAFADTTMTPWIIHHTSWLDPRYRVGPISIFVLASPASPGAMLHQIRRDPDDDDSSEMNLDYRPGAVKVAVLQRGRSMFGVSRQPDKLCPRDLWPQVAVKNAPAAWTEPRQDNGGFRVLVPHAEAGKAASYVSALRADVLPESGHPRAVLPQHFQL